MDRRGTTPHLAGVPPEVATPFSKRGRVGPAKGGLIMRRLMLAALAAGTMLLSAPASAQDIPLVNGNFWNVSEVTVDDGHFADYADFLMTQYRKNMEFQKSKGWIKDYYILANANKRSNEPDLYLVTIFDHVTTPAEDLQREKDFNAFMAQTSRQLDAASGTRAKYRHLGGNYLLQELVPRK